MYFRATHIEKIGIKFLVERNKRMGLLDQPVFVRSQILLDNNVQIGGFFADCHSPGNGHQVFDHLGRPQPRFLDGFDGLFQRAVFR